MRSVWLKHGDVEGAAFAAWPGLPDASLAAENVVGLRRDADESGALRHLFELRCADIGHHRAHAAEDLAHRIFDRTAIGRLDRLAFGRSITGDAAGVLVHRRFRRHAVE